MVCNLLPLEMLWNNWTDKVDKSSRAYHTSLCVMSNFQEMLMKRLRSPYLPDLKLAEDRRPQACQTMPKLGH